MSQRSYAQVYSAEMAATSARVQAERAAQQQMADGQDILTVVADATGVQNDYIDGVVSALWPRPVFCYFHALWCPDCTRTTPLVRKAFALLPPGHAALIEIDVGEKAEYRDKTSAHRAKLAKHKLVCLPTLLCCGKDERLDKALEECEDAVKGQSMIDEYMCTCDEQGFWWLRHPIKLYAGGALLCCLLALVIAKELGRQP